VDLVLVHGAFHGAWCWLVCRDDRATNPAWGRRAAMERLGSTAVELDGGHSPFLTRPVELAQAIEEMACDLASGQA
jgi:pimeloyl-ACP methyl ester carboxylesterase